MKKVFIEYNPYTLTTHITVDGKELKANSELANRSKQGIRIHKYARPEDVPAHTVFVITTDGMENASHKYSYDAVREMIEAKKKQGWEFMFIGANIDAAAEAARIGISRENAANYAADSIGTGTVFAAVSRNLGFVRVHGKNSAHWQAEIEDDLRRRKK